MMAAAAADEGTDTHALRRERRPTTVEAGSGLSDRQTTSVERRQGRVCYTVSISLSLSVWCFVLPPFSLCFSLSVAAAASAGDPVSPLTWTRTHS